MLIYLSINIYIFLFEYLFVLLIAQKRKLLRSHLISDHILGEKTTPKFWNTPLLFLMMVMMNPLINVREILTCMAMQKTLLVQFFAVAICHAKPKCKYFHQKYQILLSTVMPNSLNCVQLENFKIYVCTMTEC